MANGQQNAFTDHPQRYPKATSRASALVQSIQQMMKKGPRTLIATIVDTSFHVTQGYVLATTELGIVQVYGVPMGSVVNQMRILVRQQGGQSSTRSMIFDGYAPVLSSQAQTGSLLFNTPLPIASGTYPLAKTTTSIATVTGMNTVTGYYWHCFFYIPQLPTNFCTLFSMSGSGPQLNLDLLPEGKLRFWSTDGHGYITTSPIAPHHIHWVQIQPGLAGNLELLIDGVAGYTGLSSSGDKPNFSGNGASYALSALTDPSANNPCPLGTWISRIGFGASYSGGTIALSTGTTIPADDTKIPLLNSGSSQFTYALYLCNDTPGSTSAANSAPGSTASVLSLPNPTYATISTLGPY